MQRPVYMLLNIFDSMHFGRCLGVNGFVRDYAWYSRAQMVVRGRVSRAVIGVKIEGDATLRCVEMEESEEMEGLYR